jgi:hypothetical protein
MLEPLPEPELRQHVAQGKLRPETGARDARIFRALRRIIDSGSVFHILWDTPGQREDYFSILVDDKVVIDFELDRHDPEALPTEAEQHSIEDYRKGGDDFTRAKLRVALEFAREKLGR